MQTIGYELKVLRIERGMTQKELAQASGLGLNSIINLEQGRNVSPSTIRKVRSILMP